MTASGSWRGKVFRSHRPSWRGKSRCNLANAKDLAHRDGKLGEKLLSIIGHKFNGAEPQRNALLVDLNVIAFPTEADRRYARQS